MRSILSRALQSAQRTCPWAELSAVVGPAANSFGRADYTTSAATADAAASWSGVLRSKLQGGFKSLQRQK
jgi:hypothetical protein